jgi:hypothetical protein
MDHVGIKRPDEAYGACKEANVMVESTLVEADEANPRLRGVLFVEATRVIDRERDVVPALLELSRQNQYLTLRTAPAKAPN